MKYGLIKVNVADVRAEPKFQSERLTQAIFDEEVEILDEKGDWSYIKLVDGYLGWIQSNRILEVNKDRVDDFLSQVNYVVSDGIINLYERASFNSDILTKLVFNTKLVIGKLIKDFAEVICPDDKRGWVEKTKILNCAAQKRANSGNVKELIKVAKNFIGVPYLWGGKTTFGFDCSGFVQTLFDFFLVKIPRDTKDQIKYGSLVSRENLRLGDLIFFPGHVGIYLGNGEIIHANLGRGCVSIDSLEKSNPNYIAELDKNFLEARRYF